MKIRLNKAHFPVTVLGPGRRVGLWTQGCSIGCAGCLSRDTWDADPQTEIEIDELLAWCKEVSAVGFDGITISGGEPFQQPAALEVLLDRLHAWRCEAANPFDILCYSGYSIAKLRREFNEILCRLDALIPEPFVESLPQGKIWRGSSNQPLIPLSELGHSRYDKYIDADWPGKGTFQVTESAGQLWLVGIPDRDDLHKLEDLSSKRGVIHRGVSWRA